MFVCLSVSIFWCVRESGPQILQIVDSCHNDVWLGAVPGQKQDLALVFKKKKM